MKEDEEEEDKIPKSYQDCPLSIDSLGYYTWSFLHTMAAYYPQKPSDKQKELMNNFFLGFTEFYPCSHCKKDLQREIKQKPINIESNQEFQQWLCYLHNDVNLKLGKPQFDCSIENLELRWKKGYKHCQYKK